MTFQTDIDGLFWPQVLRGAAVMFCILPTTRLAMEGWKTEDAPDASGQFNLMRNLGGAIGIALIDTILAQRAPEHARHIIDRLQAGDAATAARVGLPTEYFHGVPMGPVDPAMRAYVEPFVQHTALTEAFNEAWIVLGALFLLSLVAVAFMRSGVWQPGRESEEA
jgi:DHA2 family multidrug resistance protein